MYFKNTKIGANERKEGKYGLNVDKKKCNKAQYLILKSTG